MFVMKCICTYVTSSKSGVDAYLNNKFIKYVNGRCYNIIAEYRVQWYNFVEPWVEFMLR